MGDWTVDGNLSVDGNYLMDVGGGINTPATIDIIADANAQANYTIKIYRCAYTSYTGTLPSGFQYGFFLVFKRSIGSSIPNGGTIVAFNYESRIAICNNTYGEWGDWSIIDACKELTLTTGKSTTITFPVAHSGILYVFGAGASGAMHGQISFNTTSDGTLSYYTDYTGSALTLTVSNNQATIKASNAYAYLRYKTFRGNRPSFSALF